MRVNAATLLILGGLACMIAQRDGRSDSTIRGTLTLRQTVLRPGTLASLNPAHQPDVVLTGYTDLAVELFGNIAEPATSQDSLYPGVQVLGTGNFQLDIGDPFTPDGFTLDAGLLLDIQRIEDSSFTGRWVSGSDIVPLPHGYYCAIRRAG